MIRRLTVAALIGAAVIAAPAAPAQAYAACKADYQCTTTYYSNASHTTIVGYFDKWCDGTTSQSGEMTGYAVLTQVGCTESN